MTTTPSLPTSIRTSVRTSIRMWILTCFLAAASAWALLIPLATGADESSHLRYAAAVVRGEHAVVPGTLMVIIPAQVADTDSLDCAHRRSGQSIACAPGLSAVRGDVRVSTTAAGYPRPYYWFIGLPTLGTFDAQSWYLMRELSVCLCTLLLAIGLWAVRPDRLGGAALGVLFAASPTVLALVGVLNPSGPEITAALAAGVAGGALYDALALGDRRRTARAVLSIALLTGYLAVARPSTITMALGVVFLIAVLIARPLLAALRRAPVATIRGAAVVILSIATAQVLVGATSRPIPSAGAVSWRSVLRSYVLPAIAPRLQESVMRIADVNVARGLVVLVLLALGAVMLTAVVVGDLVDKIVVLGAIAAALVIGPAFAFHTVFRNGQFYQARYALALFSVAVTIGAGVVARRRPGWVRHRIVAAVPLGWALVMLAMMVAVLARYAHGLPGPFSAVSVIGHHDWLPPAWPLVLLLIGLMLASAYRVRTLLIDSGGLPRDREPEQAPDRLLLHTA